MRYWAIANLTILSAAALQAQRLSLTDLDQRLSAIEQRPTPNQIALLRWFPARNGLSLLQGAGVEGVAFDGDHVWVSTSEGALIKVRASDNAVLGTFQVGADGRGLAFDGANLWVAGGFNNVVRKVRASDGSVLATIPAGTTPMGAAFDGTNMWIVGGIAVGGVTKIRVADNVVQGSFVTGAQAVAAAFDGTHIWGGEFQ